MTTLIRHSRPTSLGLLLAGTAGVLIATQVRINASLGERLHSSVLAALVSFASGLALLLCVVPARQRALQGFQRLRHSGLPAWSYVGGLVGASQVTTFTFVVPTIGIVLFAVTAVGGQVVGGMLVDRVGLGPAGRTPPTAPRIAGAMIALCAIALAQVGKPIGEIAFWQLALVWTVNVFVGPMLALNGRVGKSASDPVVATTIHFAVATVCLALVAGVLATLGEMTAGGWPSQAWLYLGGVFGITLIGCMTIAAGTIDVLRLALVANGGQLLGALVLDGAVPGGPGVSGWLALSALLTLLAVTVADSQRARLSPPRTTIDRGSGEPKLAARAGVKPARGQAAQPGRATLTRLPPGARKARVPGAAAGARGRGRHAGREARGRRRWWPPGRRVAPARRQPAAPRGDEGPEQRDRATGAPLG